MSKIIILDTETTGLPPTSGYNQYMNPEKSDLYSNCRIVQISWIALDEKIQITDEFNAVIKPVGFVIPPSSFHEVTMEIAEKDGLSMEYVLDSLIEYMKNCKCIVGYNLSFDINVLLSELYRFGNKYQGLINDIKKCTKECAMQLAVTKFKLKRNFKLTDIYEHLFKSTFQAHNSLEDVYATARCYISLKDNQDIIQEIKNARQDFDMIE